MVCDAIKKKIIETNNNPDNLIINNTICTQVARRHSNLIEFAKSHSVIIFVSGKESSNGKVLFDLCKSVNERTYKIESLDQLDRSLLKEDDFIGICGATSTPKWQLEAVAESVLA